MDEKLKPCPFCGDEMVKGEFGFDHPENDDCIIGFGSFANYYRAAWNTRTPSRNDVLEEAGDMAEVTDVVERVARALCEVHIRNVRRWDTDPAELEKMIPKSVDHIWKDFVQPARAALAAMLEAVGEPTPAMLKAFTDRALRISVSSDYTWNDYAADQWKAMLAASPLYSLAALREALPPPPQD